MRISPGVRRWALAATAIYLVVIFIVVFALKMSDLRLLEMVSIGLQWFHERGVLIGVRYGHVEAAANVIFFIPLGFLLPLVFSRRRLLVGWLSAVVLSVAIEVVQYFLLAGRVGSLRDVITNSLGAAVGSLLIFIVSSMAISHRKRRYRVTAPPVSNTFHLDRNTDPTRS